VQELNHKIIEKRIDVRICLQTWVVKVLVELSFLNDLPLDKQNQVARRKKKSYIYDTSPLYMFGLSVSLARSQWHHDFVEAFKV
jgi:hypothetical protein